MVFGGGRHDLCLLEVVFNHNIESLVIQNRTEVKMNIKIHKYWTGRRSFAISRSTEAILPLFLFFFLIPSDEVWTVKESIIAKFGDFNRNFLSTATNFIFPVFLVTWYNLVWCARSSLQESSYLRVASSLLFLLLCHKKKSILHCASCLFLKMLWGTLTCRGTL